MIVLFCFGATSKETADKSSKNTGRSPYQGLMATDTTNVTNYNIGTLYGIADSVEVVFTGTDADGFTITVSHLPKKEIGGTITFPAKITKFTKLVTAASGEYGFETVSTNSNVAIGAVFTGDVYITVSDFEGTAWFVNIITDSTSIAGGAGY